MNTVEKLERLGEIKKAIEKLKADETAEIETILTPEIRAEIEKIGLKWAEKIAEFQSLKEQLEAEVTAEVLTAGETVKSPEVMAVWNKARVSWDGKKLDGMMALIPQLSEARKVGDPTVSFRYTHRNNEKERK